MHMADPAISRRSAGNEDEHELEEPLRKYQSPYLSVSPALSGYEFDARCRRGSVPGSGSEDSASPNKPLEVATRTRSRRRGSTRQCNLGFTQAWYIWLILYLVTPEEYSQSVSAHSRRSPSTSLYPGQNYIDLAAWLESKQQGQEKRIDDHCLAVICDFTLKGRDRVQHLGFNSLDGIHTSNHLRTEKNAGRVLLLRGCPPAEWITTIGGRFGIDPEFVHRHLDFFATLIPRSVFALPSLPSSSANIVQLCTCTILSRDASVMPIVKSDLQARRRDEAERMATYRRNFQSTCGTGESIVRDFSTMDDQYSILEQRISMCVQRDEEGWIGITL